MLYATPVLGRADLRRIATLDELRRRLGDGTGVAAPWLGQLRRQVRTAAVESSVGIEGFSVPAEDAVGLVAGTQSPDPADSDANAVACYARAMDHVGTMAIDPTFRWLDRVILDLHFDVCWFQRDRSPGLWRTAPVSVTSSRGGSPVYTAPDPDHVPELMAEVVGWLRYVDLEIHVAVRAAMAHLHVVSVHPFRDGNGRVARIVQSLVLARAGLLAPELNSIEEHLASHTGDYYRVLQQVHGATYQPERDATPWVRFCLDAHIAQAQRHLERLELAGERWAALERLVEARGWPDRMVIALEQSLFGGVERAAYAAEAAVSPATATGDLRRLVDAGLVVQRGRTRATRYVASDHLHHSLPEGSAPGERELP